MCRISSLSQEYAELEPVTKAWREYRQLQDDIAGARELLDDGDEEMRAMAEEEIRDNEEKAEALEAELQRLLLP